MSKYTQIKTEFKNGASLCKALTALGVTYNRSADLCKNGAVLMANWTRWGGVNQDVAVAVQKHSPATGGLCDMDGLGFKWNGAGYDLVQDHYDQENSTVQAALGRLRQEYAKAEVYRLAQSKGYTVREQPDKTGVIRLELVRR